MKSMTLELDDRDVMVIGFLLFCEREIIFETIFCLDCSDSKQSP